MTGGAAPRGRPAAGGRGGRRSRPVERVMTKVRNRIGPALLGGALLLGLGAAAGLAEDENGHEVIVPPLLTPEMLSDPNNIAIGEAIWHEQCTHCHGAKAYPGKAPKLRPARYKPEFVYHRVANGFRGMPAWSEIYSQEEIIGIVAYVKSKEFSP